MELLEIVDNVAVPSPYTLTILEFKELDTKELAYVYFMHDHRSPYAVYDISQRHDEVVLGLYGGTGAVLFFLILTQEVTPTFFSLYAPSTPNTFLLMSSAFVTSNL